jgi:hypothetical protein
MEPDFLPYQAGSRDISRGLGWDKECIDPASGRRVMP